MAEQSEILQEAIEEATEYIIECEVPICDYTIEGKVETLADKLRNSIKKVMVLNKAKEIRKFKFLELI